jgi:oligosaccharyltransferase complex subunit beta
MIILGQSSQTSTQKKTLVLMDPDNLKLPITHSLFFNDLTVRGHKLTFARADDSALALTSYGEFLYDNLVVLSSKTEDFGGSIDVAAILDFVDSGRNLLLVATPDASDSIRELAIECGVAIVDDEGAFVQDHFSHHTAWDEGNHTLIISKDIVAPSVIFSNVRPSNTLARICVFPNFF